MQSVSRERVAAFFLRDARKLQGAHEIDEDRHAEDGEDRPARIDVDLMRRLLQAAHGFAHDEERKAE